MSSSFLKPVCFLMLSFFTLSFMKFPIICVGTYDVLPLVSSSVWQTVAIHVGLRYAVMLTKRAFHVVWLLSSDLYPCSSRYSSAGRRHLMLSRFLCCTLCHSFHCSIYGSQVTVGPNPRPLLFLHPRPSLQSLTMILHFAAFMHRPTYPDIFSTSSDNFCMPVCEVSMKAIIGEI